MHRPKTFLHPLEAGKKPKPLTDETIKDMAMRLMRYLSDRDLFYDAVLYYHYDGQWVSCHSNVFGNTSDLVHKTETVNGKTYEWWERQDDEPSRYFEWNGDILSMSFEGPLYHALNTHYTENEYLRNFFSHYGLHFELGNAWNFTLYSNF